MKSGGGKQLSREESLIIYRKHKRSARKRRIPFLLSFEEWLDIWGEYLPKRGAGRGKYVMARYGDRGPYAVDNVRIATFEENSVEARLGLRNSEAHHAALRAGYRRVFPEKPIRPCNCGCGELCKPGRNFIHGHAGRIRFQQIAKDRIGKPRAW